MGSAGSTRVDQTHLRAAFHQLNISLKASCFRIVANSDTTRAGTPGRVQNRAQLNSSQSPQLFPRNFAVSHRAMPHPETIKNRADL